MDFDNTEHTPIIGKDVNWQDIEGQFIRANNFIPLSVIENDKIKGSTLEPYALVSVELPESFKDAVVWVLNKVDFRNFWDVFMNRGINKEMEEVLIVFAPPKKKGLSKLIPEDALPRWRIFVYPKGRFEDFNNPSSERPEGLEGYIWAKPIAEWQPD